jgi:hypothetical protein
MIDIHHLVYAGVLLVFLTGVALMALAGFLTLGTGFLAALMVRCVKGRTPDRLPLRVLEHPETVDLSLLMEEVEQDGHRPAEEPSAAGIGVGRGMGSRVRTRTTPAEVSVSAIRWRRRKSAVVPDVTKSRAGC